MIDDNQIPLDPSAALPSVTPAASLSTASGAKRSRHTVLVVDDEPDVVKSVKDLLRLDYKVLGATSPEEAIRILQENEVNVVMTDQRMPEMTGVQFLSRIRGNHPEAVRLLFTGYADIRAVIDAINEGKVYRYITKPWDPDELQAIIREACERYDLIIERKRLTLMLQAQNQELEKANSDLRRANELKHAFIQVASHELRTPLTILTGMTKLALSTPDTAEPLHGYLDRIERAGRRLQHLVDQIIAMLKAGQFERPLERKSEDLSALLRQCAEDVRPFINLRHQSFNVEIPADLGPFEIEASKIRDSVSHLLLNAVKFTPDGGNVSLAVDRQGVAAFIRVTDTGAGIDPDCLPRLFEPFFTGFDVSRHSSGTFEHMRKGLGLGLSLVKAFVEMHGGEVKVESESGKGTTFTIVLPQQPAKA